MTLTPRERSVFAGLCKLTQEQILTTMTKVLKREYNKVIVTKEYVIALGDIPVGLVAHADTVFRAPPQSFYYDDKQNVMWSPDGMGADDRAGIFSIIHIVNNTKLRPHIIITTDEESGCLGAGKLIAKYTQFPRPLKFLVQLDRRGKKDSVYYDCDNPTFEDFINKFGFETAFGTLSDISVLAPAWKVAAVNLSIGYRNEHSTAEFINLKDMMKTVNKVINMLTHVKNQGDALEVFKYIPSPYQYGYNYGYNYTYEDWMEGTHNHEALIKKYLGPDIATCDMCSFPTKDDEIIDVFFASTREKASICLDCFSTICHKVNWCNGCNEAWIDPEYHGDDKDFVCPVCKEKKEEEKNAE